jgi:hypothetical protein
MLGNKYQFIPISIYEFQIFLLNSEFDWEKVAKIKAQTGVADYEYDFNFLDDLKAYTHRTLDLGKIALSYPNPATHLHI